MDQRDRKHRENDAPTKPAGVLSDSARSRKAGSPMCLQNKKRQGPFDPCLASHLRYSTRTDYSTAMVPFMMAEWPGKLQKNS